MFTNAANRFETTLTDPMGETDLTASVLTTNGGPASPAYLVIEPDVVERAEVILFDGTFSGSAFATTSLGNRYLSGSAAGSGITHPAGSIVVSAPVSQMLADLHSRIDSAIMTGAILMWSGSVASIPAGWALCDGTNGTPDLTDSFVVGAGSSYAPGDTGGAANVALNTAQLPGHTHGAGNLAGGSHSHGAGNLDTDSHSHGSGNLDTDSDSHSHSYTGPSNTITAASGNQGAVGTVTTRSTGSDSHSHNVAGNTSGSSANVSGTSASSGSTVSGSTGAAGSGSAHENRPPYYALAFIMKT